MIDNKKFKDDHGRYITQGLFLEVNYDTDKAVYTLDGEDKVYKGETYVSLKKLYLEMCDPIEYIFATSHLFDWKHWQRIIANKMLRVHIDEWREELTLKLKSEGVMTMVDLATDAKSYQAGKWLVDVGWDIKSKGRPTKASVKKELKRQADIKKGFEEDFKLLDIKDRNNVS